MKTKLLKFLCLIPIAATIPTVAACGSGGGSKPKPTPIFDYEEHELPTCTITTEGGQSITSKETYISATFTIKNCAEEYKLTDVAGQIRGRGNLSWSWPKRSYSIKFDEKQYCFGSKNDYKKWALISNYGDPSLYRNYVAYTLAGKLDKLIFSPRVNMVDLYLNDKYYGVYMFCDRIDDKKGRVKIDTKISPDGNNGYLLEQVTLERAEGVENVDFINITNNLCFQIKSPDTEDNEYLQYADVETKYIKNYVQSCLSALNSGVYANVDNLMDVDSFVDGYLIEELFANLDCYRYSMYYYKDKDGKLCHGPVWDFDLSSGNINQGPGTHTSCPPDEGLWAGVTNVFYIGLMRYSEFRTKVKNRLAEFKTSFNEVMQFLDANNSESYYKKAKESIDRDNARWSTLGRNASGVTPTNLVTIRKMAGQHAFLKEWLEMRYAFLEKQFN